MFARFRHAAFAALILLALAAGFASATPGVSVAKPRPCAAATHRHHPRGKRCAALAAKQAAHRAAAARRKAAAAAKAKAKAKAKALAEAKAEAAAKAAVKAVTPVPAPQPRLFAPTSIWNAAVPAGAALDPSSNAVVASLAAEAKTEFAQRKGPWIATTASSTPILVVPAGQRLLRVALDDPTATWRMGLSAAFAAVPVPANARPAAGPDAHMTIWQPSTDTLWEFYRAHRDADGTWHAAWGGAINHVSTDPGYYTSASFTGSGSSWGATASSLPVAAGVMRIAELKAGRIDHALALNVPSARGGVWALPAQRTDGRNTAPTSLPEGAHLRLDPGLDLSRLDLPPVVRTMAVAAQRYGIVVRDQTNWATGFFAEDPLDGPNPYEGAGGIFGGTPPNFLMAKFPWSRLQLLKMDLRSK